MVNDSSPIELAYYRSGKELEVKLRKTLKTEAPDHDPELAEILAKVIRDWLDDE